jgi:co-chaperonin GroES (HSP10)
VKEVTTLKPANKSGITPSANRVLVKPDEVEKVTDGGIIIPDTEREKQQIAQGIGTLVAIGPDAFLFEKESVYEYTNGHRRLVEERITGRLEPFANIGEKVAYAKYAGLAVYGEDDEQYRILNDIDITAKVTPGVNFTDIKARKPVGV